MTDRITHTEIMREADYRKIDEQSIALTWQATAFALPYRFKAIITAQARPDASRPVRWQTFTHAYAADDGESDNQVGVLGSRAGEVTDDFTAAQSAAATLIADFLNRLQAENETVNQQRAAEAEAVGEVIAYLATHESELDRC